MRGSRAASPPGVAGWTGAAGRFSTANEPGASIDMSSTSAFSFARIRLDIPGEGTLAGAPGTWTEPDGKLEIGGTYQAQWRKVDGRWLIQAEVFVPAHCKGSKYCAARP